MQPAQNRWDGVEVNEEAGKCHLIERGKSGEKDGDTAVVDSGSEKEVL